MSVIADPSDGERVLLYWFGRDATERAAKQQLWFGGGPEIDAQIEDQFGSLVEQARAGKLDGWGATSRGALAWLILVDQFSRNIYRNRPEAFASDPAALAWTRAHHAAGKFASLSASEQLFAILPFEHAEDLEAQKEGMVLLTRVALRDPDGFAEIKGGMEFARKHLDVIARFGRFPHRNAILGRASTPEEADYLAYCKQAGTWL